MTQLTILKQLDELNNLLIAERVAITKLDMKRLKTLQQKKTEMMSLLRENEENPDDQCKKLAENVTANNKRNGWLLRSGLKIIKQQQQLNCIKQTLTYNPNGFSLNIDTGSRILNRRF